MKPFIRNGTAVEQRFSHWLCGWVEGYAIRVYGAKRKVITAAFKEWCKISHELEEYPVLDDERYSNMEYEAAIESIKANVPTLDEAKAPKNWANKVFGKIFDSNPEILQERDGSVYVDEEVIVKAITAIDPTWLLDPFGGKPPEEYEAICDHMAKADKDLVEYCKLVPHATERATQEIAKLKKKLESKRRKFIRDYFGEKKA
jgi:hypothetical protein